MSFIDSLEPIYKMLPEVKGPEVRPNLNKRILWSLIGLILFFVMGSITVIGIAPSSAGNLQQLQIILASQIGTLITIGIGPVVLASIILQLLVGGGLIKIDLTNPKDKAKFTSLQKLLAILLAFVEGSVYVFSGLIAPQPGMLPLVILQIAFGSIVLLYLDEVISKYGIGSGISLFIAGGVAGHVVWRIFNPTALLADGSAILDLANANGLIFLFVREFGSNTFIAFVNYLLPIIFTLIVFFVVVFAEGIHVNIPIAVGRAGQKSRFPVKFLYVSNIPVILAVALFANIQIWAQLVKDRVPIIDVFLAKLAAVVIPPYNIVENAVTQGISPIILEQIVQSITRLQFIGLGGDIIHAILYVIILTALSIVFGKFWVEMAGQGPEAIANQLQKGGMFIPGFRRDPRVVRSVLDRYIPPISIMGAAFVGLLAGMADLTGALGSGTGILLTVGIVYRLYEELAKQQLMETHPLIGRLLG